MQKPNCASGLMQSSFSSKAYLHGEQFIINIVPSSPAWWF